MTKNTNNLPTAAAPPPPPRVLVVGAGVGGLAAAIRLAADGAAVRVVEERSHVGGNLRQCAVPHPVRPSPAGGEDRPFRFDTGPTALALPYVFMDLFAAAGEDVRDHLPIVQIDPIVRYVWPDGMRFDFRADQRNLRDELTRLWPHDVDGFFRLLDDGRRFWAQLEPQIGMPHDADGAVQTVRRLVSLVRAGQGARFSRLLARRISSPRLREAINHFVGNVDASADRASRAAMLWIAHYHGLWHITGGMHRLAEQLERIARKLGVQIDTNRSPDMAGPDADVTVLATESGPPRESGGAVMLGIEGLCPQLVHHNVFFGEPDRPAIAVYAPTRTDSSLAPEGCETLVVRATLRGDQVVDILGTTGGLTDLRRRIVVTPQVRVEPSPRAMPGPRANAIVIPRPDLDSEDPALMAFSALRATSDLLPRRS